MSLNAASAYARTAQSGTSSRELEAMLLMKSATRMTQVRDNWDQNRSDLDGALLYNRKLWTILSVAATDKESELSDDIKKNMALLAIFIFNRSLDMMVNPEKNMLDALIEINQNIAKGLMTKPNTSQPGNE